MSTEENEYILGVDPDELQRLRSQHQVWVEQLYSLVRRAGLRDGQVVLDLGCGPGATSFELARFVGSRGKVLARDVSASFITALEQEALRLGLGQVDARQCRVEELDLEGESLDAAYGRWILSWLPDVQCVFAQLGKALKPGGVYVLQEYLNWGAMNLLPRSPVFERGVEACMASWQIGGGTINIAQEVPALAREVGLEVEYFEVNARSGQVGSLIWNWLGDFYEVYLARLVRQGGFAQTDYEDFLAEWRGRAAQGDSIVIAPIVADIVLRKPKG